ncbi:PadR family transcriptional regulator [Nocardioides sp. Y6]|uniref:PadR family transcriptional regulator n=1 Tax=Nocardioides malaquae TaxID=2773426 RepID=A0ABR9RS48_9ACTN|nr:PadR family transcriptional regulator [Nocardioides malaquae]MBE7324215.1 PadR family transcriptional regulator [Nocardioides malaquae]
MARRGESIELAVLGLLHEGPLHGYELRRRLNLLLGWGLGRVLSYGTLYPALKKMSRSQLISEDTSTPAPVTGRPRIVYRVTDLGREEFQRLMSEAGPVAWEDDTFGIRFSFFASAPSEIRLRVLEGRRTRLEERLARARADLARTQRKADRYASEYHRHGVEGVEREVRWLSDLIAAERGRQESRSSPARPVPGQGGASTTGSPEATTG